MKTDQDQRRLTAKDIAKRKHGEPLVALTAYHAQMARLLDPHCDFILVGDSVGMVVHGLASTVPVTVEMMIMHGKAVVGGSRHALIVVDMPFGSYEESQAQAFRNAAMIIKQTGCGAVKLEGGERMAATIRYLVDRGIPVMAHIGLTPQAINTLGSYNAHGRNQEEWPQIEADARSVADAGAFALVIEAVAEPLAASITQQIQIPTIGIGASSACDGQILVLDDMLGLSSRAPSFVKQYAQLGNIIAAAVEQYASDVRARKFPGSENVFAMRRKV